MYLKRALFFIAIDLFLLVNCAELPSWIKPCRRNDPDFARCFLAEGQKAYKHLLDGEPELGVPSLRPLRMRNFTLSNGFDGLRVNATDAVVHGLADGDLQDLKIDFKTKTLTVRLKQNIHLICKYWTYGKLLQIPMRGNGNLEVIGTGLDWSMNMKWDLVKGRDNQEYLKIKKVRSKYEIQHAAFKFDGLINKDVDIAMNRLMNDNWRSVIADLGDPGLRVLQKKFVEIIGNILSKLPYEVLFPV